MFLILRLHHLPGGDIITTICHKMHSGNLNLDFIVLKILSLTSRGNILLSNKGEISHLIYPDKGSKVSLEPFTDKGCSFRIAVLFFNKQCHLCLKKFFR